LSRTSTQFDNGYWYATELKDFAETIGIPSASRLRKNELERRRGSGRRKRSNTVVKVQGEEIRVTDRPPKSTEYALGYSEQEAERLKIQAQFLRGLTETFFRAAGVGEGMRVLDVGCGVGDVAMLAADLAGPSGTVLGVDRDAGSIDKARLRAAERGYAQRVSFERVDPTEFQTTEKFDAVVGRYVLLYQSDPTDANAR
jgi:2-polyprenyl-3-methyl-5-hydroxy-6-metoxy-1,4-benzoquinol methylase